MNYVFYQIVFKVILDKGNAVLPTLIEYLTLTLE